MFKSSKNIPILHTFLIKHINFTKITGISPWGETYQAVSEAPLCFHLGDDHQFVQIDLEIFVGILIQDIFGAPRSALPLLSYSAREKNCSKFMDLSSVNVLMFKKKQH